MLPAKIVANFLSDKGVTHAFDVAGGMIAFIEDAISKTRGIQCSPNHHEQGCGFAAEGFARMGKNFGVAMATSGPGATNLLTAIGSCFFDSVPVLFITGQVNTNDLKKHKNIRQNGFQETDIVTVARSLTKYSVMVRNPNNILYELEKAYFLMKHGRPGPVLLDIPIDVQRTPVKPANLRRFLGSAEHKKLSAVKSKAGISKKIKQLAKLLQKAKAPVILVGGGARISNTTAELRMFAAKNNLPVVCSLMGLDSFPAADKNFVGFIGSYGNREANMVLANADLVIALGSRLDLRQTGNPKLFAKNPTIVHVDIDRYSINTGIRSQLSFNLDLNEFFVLAKHLRAAKKTAWLHFIAEIKTYFSRPLLQNKNVDPNTFLAGLSASAGPASTIVSDVGNHQMWLAQSWQTKIGQRILFSGGMGSMGFALPAAIGAYFAELSRDLIIVCGDGGFQMNIQELETVRRNKIPAKIFLLNNKSLGMVRAFQSVYFKNNYQSTVIGYSTPDFKKIAYAYDLDYIAVERGDKKTDFKKILRSKKATLIEVKLRASAPLEPKVIFGKPLDDQHPFLNEKKRRWLKTLKEELRHGK